jgi:hypothetical protein
MHVRKKRDLIIAGVLLIFGVFALYEFNDSQPHFQHSRRPQASIDFMEEQIVSYLDLYSVTGDSHR